MKKSEWAALISILALFVLWAEGWGRQDGAGDLPPIWALQGSHNSFAFTSYPVPVLPARPEGAKCQPEEPLCAFR